MSEPQNELDKFKSDLAAFDKEQLIEMVITTSIMNKQLQSQIQLQHNDFINAIKTNTNETVESLGKVSKQLHDVFSASKKLQKENIALWITVAVLITFLAVIFIR